MRCAGKACSISRSWAVASEGCAPALAVEGWHSWYMGKAQLRRQAGRRDGGQFASGERPDDPGVDVGGAAEGGEPERVVAGRMPEVAQLSLTNGVWRTDYGWGATRMGMQLAVVSEPDKERQAVHFTKIARAVVWCESMELLLNRGEISPEMAAALLPVVQGAHVRWAADGRGAEGQQGFGPLSALQGWLAERNDQEHQALAPMILLAYGEVRDSYDRLNGERLNTLPEDGLSGLWAAAPRGVCGSHYKTTDLDSLVLGREFYYDGDSCWSQVGRAVLGGMEWSRAATNEEEMALMLHPMPSAALAERVGLGYSYGDETTLARLLDRVEVLTHREAGYAAATLMPRVLLSKAREVGLDRSQLCRWLDMRKSEYYVYRERILGGIVGFMSKDMSGHVSEHKDARDAAAVFAAVWEHSRAAGSNADQTVRNSLATICRYESPRDRGGRFRLRKRARRVKSYFEGRDQTHQQIRDEIDKMMRERGAGVPLRKRKDS